MSSDKRQFIAGLRVYHQEEIETMVRQMKIEGGALEDCIAEMRLLADFVRCQADGLRDTWPTLLQGTHYQAWERSRNELGAADITNVQDGYDPEDPIVVLAVSVFGSSAKANVWLSTPDPRHSNQTAIDMLGTDEGRATVKEMLIQMDEGLFS